MRRRAFLTKSTIAVSLGNSPTPSQANGQVATAGKEIRSAGYLHRAREDRYLPKQPVPAASYRSAGVQMSPMPLSERLKRGIVPRHGFCRATPE